MVTLKAFLDKLAGPDHPFCKGAPVEVVNEKKVKPEEGAAEKVEATPEVKLNKYLRMNTN